MISKQEFISKIRERDRNASRAALTLGILLGLFCIGMAGLDYAKTRNYLGWAGDVDIGKVMLALWMIACVLVVIRLIVVTSGKRGVSCPHCKRQLQSIPAQITVATGFCGSCGEQIFEQTYKKA